MDIFVKKINSFDEYQREISCYILLKNSIYVPKLIDSDIDNLTITLEFVGTSVWELQTQKKKVSIYNPDLQISELIDDLKQANILHLDINPRNLLVNNGQIYLIDFEKSCVNNISDNFKLEKRRIKTINRGGYQYLKKIWLEQINSIKE